MLFPPSGFLISSPYWVYLIHNFSFSFCFWWWQLSQFHYLRQHSQDVQLPWCYHTFGWEEVGNQYLVQHMLEVFWFQEQWRDIFHCWVLFIGELHFIYQHSVNKNDCFHSIPKRKKKKRGVEEEEMVVSSVRLLLLDLL